MSRIHPLCQSRRRIAAAGIALACALPALSFARPAWGADPTTWVIATDGDDADFGLLPGETVNVEADRDVMRISRSDDVLFDGFAGTGNTFRVVRYLGDTKEIQAIVDVGTPVPAGGSPNVPGGYAFASISDERFTPGGDLAIFGDISNGGQRRKALIVFDPATPANDYVAAVEEFTTPGLCTLVTVGNGIFANDFGFNGDTAAFPIIPLGTCEEDEKAMARRVGTANADILATGATPIPGVPGKFFRDLFSGVVVSEHGDTLFLGRHSNSPNHVHMLFHAPAGGAAQLLAQTRGLVPGTNHEIRSITRQTFGAPARQGDAQRMAWIARATENPQTSGDDGRDGFVFDTAAGSNPLFGTGSDDGFFAILDVNNIALGGTETVVAVCESASFLEPEIGDFDAVWRHSPDAGLHVVLWEGGPVPGAADSFPRIDRIYTANVNEHGRIAAEVNLVGNTKAIIIEESGHPDDAPVFGVPVIQRGDFVASGDVFDVIGISNVLSAKPTLTGPGWDGRQCRFNPRGRFVFRASVRSDQNSAQRDGVFITTVEEIPEDCDIEIRKRGRNIVATARGADCELEVLVENGNYTFTSIGNTTINGEPAPLALTANGGFTMTFLRGENAITVFGSGSPDADIPGNLTIRGGSGSTAIRLQALRVGRNVSIDAGRQAGARTLIVSNVQIGGKLRASAVEGMSSEYRLISVRGKSTIRLGTGDGAFAEFNDVGLGKTTITGGPGDDDLDIEEASFDGPLKIDLGGGAVNALRFVAGDVEKKLTINAAKGVTVTSLVEDVVVHNGSLVVNTGRGGSTLCFTDVDVEKKATIKTGGSAANNGTNRIEISRMNVADALVLRGKGSHDIDVYPGCELGEGLALNVRGGSTDQVHLRDIEVPGKGLLQVSSKALTRAEVLIEGCTVAGKGSLSVRTGNGEDDVCVERNTVGGRLQVSSSDGDDIVRANENTIGKDLRLLGGRGTDSLDNGSTPNVITGSEAIDSFEDVIPPKLDIDDGPSTEIDPPSLDLE